MKLRRKFRQTRKEIHLRKTKEQTVIAEHDISLTRLLLSPEGAVLRTEEDMEVVDIEEKLAAARRARLEVPVGHEQRIRAAEKLAEEELAAEEELRKENEKEKEVSHEQATEGR
jgi:hypothetical protein